MIEEKATLAVKVKILQASNLDWYPGWVECVLYDAFGICHAFHEKIPVVINEELVGEEELPKEGMIRCERLKMKTTADGRILWKITTENPYRVESVEGKTEFWIDSKQIAEK